MSLGKKIILLLILLVFLIAYSIYNFDYKTILSKSGDIMDSAKSSLQSENGNSILDKFSGIKDKILSSMDSTNELKATSGVNTSFDLVKENGNITLNGMFKDEAEAKKVMEILNINREGNFSYNEKSILNEVTLNKISSLITPFKDFFHDGSKLSFINGEIKLDGELKDPNYKDLLDSIITRVDLDIQSNIKKPNISKTQEIIASIKENGTSNLSEIKLPSDKQEVSLETEKPDIKVEIENIDNKIDGKEQTNVISNLSQKSKKIQSEINQILANKKINFERRSVKITDDSYSAVKDIANLLSENKNIKIEVAGHTDSRGSASLNKRISQDRANSVMNSLIDLGISKDRLKAVGYGEDFPIAQDDADGLSEINRRVEFNIIGE